LEVALTTGQAQELAEVTVESTSILTQAAHQALAESGYYDLIIYDDCAPVRMPRANTLFVGSLPPGDAWQAKPGQGAPLIIDVDRVHPLTQLVEMSNVKIAKGLALEPPAGSTVLVDSVVGNLVALAPREGFEDAVIGFSFFEPSEAGDLSPNTNWPLRPSFPVFALNALRYLGGVRSALAADSAAPGDAVTLRAPADVEQMTVVDPQGTEHELRRSSQAAFVYTNTNNVGVYEVREGEGSEIAQRFVVNLFDERESDLRPATSLDLGHQQITGTAGLAPARREMWRWILLAGLGLLVFEWYVYNRRVYL
jgi:hypothetical protein